MDLFVQALQGGLASLASYLAAHVLLCLVPAFFVAGALSALVPQASVVRFLGPQAPKWLAYPAAAGAGSLLAVCSCTVQPLFAGIYKRGAGLGPAVTFLFFAPAANILALSYTGVALGAEFAFARVILSLAFGLGIGLLMATIFHREDAARSAQAATVPGGERIGRRTLLFLLALVALLIAGTLKLDFLGARMAEIEAASPAALELQATLDRLVPRNTITGEEGITVQGAVLVVLLGLITLTSIRGLGKVDEGFNRWTKASLGLIAATLVVAALSLNVTERGWAFAITGRTLAIALLLGILPLLARRFEAWSVQQWLWETWRFARQIFPLLLVGVFVVGVLRVFIRPEWVRAVAGANTVTGNLAGVGFGIFLYFPTLVEVPVAKMLLSLGMHPGPLIAYLMADPELSLQSILITTSIIGRTKTWTYVGLVALFSLSSGFLYGAWADGASMRLVLPAVAGFVALATFTFWIVNKLKEARHGHQDPGQRLPQVPAP